MPDEAARLQPAVQSAVQIDRCPPLFCLPACLPAHLPVCAAAPLLPRLGFARLPPRPPWRFSILPSRASAQDGQSGLRCSLTLFAWLFTFFLRCPLHTHTCPPPPPRALPATRSLHHHLSRSVRWHGSAATRSPSLVTLVSDHPALFWLGSLSIVAILSEHREQSDPARHALGAQANAGCATICNPFRHDLTRFTSTAAGQLFARVDRLVVSQRLEKSRSSSLLASGDCRVGLSTSSRFLHATLPAKLPSLPVAEAELRSAQRDHEHRLARGQLTGHPG